MDCFRLSSSGVCITSEHIANTSIIYGVLFLVAGIGDIRNDHDANLTYEGENHVLIQQTSNWLLKIWPEILRGVKISTPMKSANFLTNALSILKNTRIRPKSVEELCAPES